MVIIVGILLGILGLSTRVASGQEPQPESSRKIVNRVVPAYPDLARSMQIHGTVRVLVIVDPSGKVKSSQPVGGNPVLIKSALEAIGKWKWVSAPQETKELIQLDFHP
jgi:TonB family protein